MKVIMVVPNLVLAGAEMMCASLSLELKKRGIPILVVSMFNQQTSLTSLLEQNGVKIIYLDKHLGFDPRMIIKLKKIFDEEKPDIVHTHLDCIKYAAIAAHISTVPRLIHTVHNMAEKEAAGIVQKFNYFLFKFYHIVPVALSPEVQDSIVSTYKLNKKNIPIIFNGIDLSKCIVKQSYSANKLTFVHVGRFAKQKNHEMLIDAFSQYSKSNPSTELWLIGEGELFETILEKSKKLGIEDKVVFWGKRKDVLDIICNADVFVLPSLYEGVPISIIEAMGTALPIIATDVGGIASMLDDTSGILINCNKGELVKAMEKMEEESTREKLGQNAIKIASEKFSIEIMVNKYIEIYSK